MDGHGIMNYSFFHVFPIKIAIVRVSLIVRRIQISSNLLLSYISRKYLHKTFQVVDDFRVKYQIINVYQIRQDKKGIRNRSGFHMPSLSFFTHFLSHQVWLIPRLVVVG